MTVLPDLLFRDNIYNALFKTGLFCYVQAPPRSITSCGRKRGKPMLATSTPEMKRLRADIDERNGRKKKASSQCKKTLFSNPPKNVESKKKVRRKPTARSVATKTGKQCKTAVTAGPIRRPRPPHMQPLLPRKPVWMQGSKPGKLQ